MKTIAQKVMGAEDPIDSEHPQQTNPQPIKIITADYVNARSIMKILGLPVNSPGTFRLFLMFAADNARYAAAMKSGQITQNMYVDSINKAREFAKENKGFFVAFARQYDKRRGL